MNKFDFGILTAFVLVLGLMLSGFASADTIPVTNVQLQLNGMNLQNNSMNSLNVLRGNKMNLRLTFDSAENASNVQVMATIFGYEYSQYNTLTSESTTFDTVANVTYAKYLTLTLPNDILPGQYKLRIFFADANGNTKTYEYNLMINTERHNVSIDDVMLSPNNNINAGSYLIGRIRVKNTGSMNENNVMTTLSIPSLGLTAQDYLDTIAAGDAASSNDLALKIPSCTKPGQYKVYATVKYNNGYSTINKTETIKVLSSGTCQLETPSSTGKTIISVQSSSQSGYVGQTETYSMNAINTGSASKTYTVEAQNADWATVNVNPALLVLGASGTNAISVSVTPKAGTTVGDHVLFVVIKSQGETVQQIPLTYTVKENVTEQQTQPSTSGLSNLRAGLEIAIIVLVVVLIIIALIVGFTKGRQKDDEEDETKTYY